MSSAYIMRVFESVVTFFVVTLVGLAAATLVGVDATDTHAVAAALVLAVGGAVSATIKHFVPALTTLSPKGE